MATRRGWRGRSDDDVAAACAAGTSMTIVAVGVAGTLTTVAVGAVGNTTTVAAGATGR